jgi:hypothetical protein
MLAGVADRGALRAIAGLRRMTLAAGVLVMVQSAVGVVVNLHVMVPPNHSGANPTSYLSGSSQSVAWAIGHGALSLAIHASLGLALVVLAALVAVRSISLRAGWVAFSSTLGAGLVVGAGFNGASFLDFNRDASSLIMALLAFGAGCCYLWGLYLLAAFDHRAYRQ